MVDAVDEHRRIVLRRRRHDHLLRAGSEVLLRRLLGQEQAGGLHHHFRADIAPLELGGVLDRGQADAAAVDHQRVAIHRDLALETAVHRVVAQHVGEVCRFEEVVDADDLDVREILDCGAEDHASDASEAVDAHLDRHCVAPWLVDS